MRIAEQGKNSVYASFNRNLFKVARTPRKTTTRVHLVFTPEYRNYGDQAIAIASRRLLHNTFSPAVEILEEPNAFCSRFPDVMQKLIGERDLIVLTGGGFVGSLWPELQSVVEGILARFPNNPIVMLPQSCYFEGMADDAILHFRKLLTTRNSLTIFARENNSQTRCRDYLSLDEEVRLAPDCALSLDEFWWEGHREGIGICLRNDKEKTTDTTSETILEEVRSYLGITKSIHLSTVGNMRIPLAINRRQNSLLKTIIKFQQSELVITDRLHAMIFCAICGTPCVALDNLSKKVSGVYEQWLSSLPYIQFVEKSLDIPTACMQILDQERNDRIVAWNKNKHLILNARFNDIKHVCRCSIS